jgi:hypothetical protein
MHSKLQLLAHPTHLRVVVPSANLVPFGRPSPSGLIVLHLYSRTLSHALVTILAPWKEHIANLFDRLGRDRVNGECEFLEVT